MEDDNTDNQPNENMIINEDSVEDSVEDSAADNEDAAEDSAEVAVTDEVVDAAESSTEVADEDSTDSDQEVSDFLRYLRLRSRNLPTPINTNRQFNAMLTPTEIALQSSLYDEKRFREVISEEGEKQLIHTKYAIDASYNETCPITQEPFKEGEDIIGLPCNHYFKPEPINIWLKENNAICPVCRFKISSKEERVNSTNPRPDYPSMNSLLMQDIQNAARRRLIQQSIQRRRRFERLRNRNVYTPENSENSENMIIPDSLHNTSEDTSENTTPTPEVNTNEASHIPPVNQSILTTFINNIQHNLTILNQEIENMHEEEDNMDLQNAILASINDNNNDDNVDDNEDDDNEDDNDEDDEDDN